MNLWGVYELSQYLNVAPSWVRAHAGEIPHIRVGKYLRFDPESESFKVWLASLKRSQYDSAALSGTDGPMGEKDMARLSYQNGTVEWKETNRGKFAVLRYRLRDGDQWKEKTETLMNSNGQLCRTPKEAEKARAARMLEVNHQNNQRRARSMTFAAFVNDLWNPYNKDQNRKPSTVAQYNSYVDRHIMPYFRNRQLSEVTPEDVTLFFRQQAHLASSTRHTLFCLLNSIFGLATDYDLIPVSPVRRKLHRPIVENRAKVSLSSRDLRKVIEAIKPAYQALFICLALTGLRIGEALALRWQDVDFENHRLRIMHTLWQGHLLTTKTAKVRMLHLSSVLMRVLQSHRQSVRWTEPEHYVFCQIDGRCFYPDRLRRLVLYPALKACGIEPGEGTHGFHLFRHSAATIVAAESKELSVAQELLGHSSASTTQIYTHWQSEAERATELLAREIWPEVSEKVN